MITKDKKIPVFLIWRLILSTTNIKDAELV